MEQYTINRTEGATSITEGKFFHRIHQKHMEKKGVKILSRMFVQLIVS